MADRDGNQAVYVISVAAELAGMHPQTLRIYERKGLLDPSRTSGGSRRFSERDLERLRHIQELTSTGLNLEGGGRGGVVPVRPAPGRGGEGPGRGPPAGAGAADAPPPPRAPVPPRPAPPRVL